MSPTSVRIRLIALGATVASAIAITAATLAPAIGNIIGQEVREATLAHAPTLEGINHASFGIGVEGRVDASNSNGVYGVAPASATPMTRGVYGLVYSAGSDGVLGESRSTDVTNFGFGVVGNSLNGPGMEAKTNQSSFAALEVINGSGGTGGTGAFARAPGNAVLGISTFQNGAVGITTATPAPGSAGLTGVLGEDLSGAGGTMNAGVAGTSTGGSGVAGTSENSNGVLAQSSAVCPLAGCTANSSFDLAALAAHGTGGGPLIIAKNSAGIDVLSLDNAGNLIIKGDFITDGNFKHGGNVGSCSPTPCPPPLAVTRTIGGTRVGTYAPQQTVPSIEDLGQARLASGSAYVRLDPQFAATIDRNASYLVFITPRGENRGLYVTNVSLAGFAVRESQGGHSTLAFDYRIVAKPLGGQAPRLPIMQASTKSAPTDSAMTVRRYSTGFVPPMVEPRLGSQLKSSNRLR